MIIKRILLITLFILSSLNADINLTAKEEAFLRNTNINAISTATWAPLNMYNDKKQLSGICIDFWELLKKKANIKSQTIIAKDWNNVLSNIENKTADITLGTSFDSKKLSYANFTTSYISFPIAFATLHDERFIPNASYLEGKTVAVGENYSSHIIMKKNFPKINFVPVKNTEEALKLLSAEKVDAAIDILPVVAHLISHKGYYNLKISGTSKHEVSMTFMIRKDYEELKSILDKYIIKITAMEKETIIKEWLTVKFDKRIVDYKYIFQALILIFIIVLFYTFKKMDLKKYNEKIEKLSKIDSLTNLDNRQAIDSKLMKLNGKAFSLILIDIDHFKEINDIYGHKAGDEVLQEFANILKINLKKNQHIGRWGGEEFLLICEDNTESQAAIIAYDLKYIIENYDFKIRKVTASFGISEANKNSDIKNVLANADNSLYKAKERGRNQVIISSTLIS